MLLFIRDVRLLLLFSGDDTMMLSCVACVILFSFVYVHIIIAIIVS